MRCRYQEAYCRRKLFIKYFACISIVNYENAKVYTIYISVSQLHTSKLLKIYYLSSKNISLDLVVINMCFKFC